jgi:hypothetical protein
MVTLGTPGGKAYDVSRGTVCLPRIGAWHADVVVDTAVAFEGPVELVIGTAATLQGTIVRGESYLGVFRARVAAGAGALTLELAPRHYQAPTLGAVLGDLAQDAGDALSATIAADLLSTPMAYWTRLRGPAGQLLRALVERATPAETAWRYLADGTLWLGAETWPDAGIETREISRTPEDAVINLGLDQPFVEPGTTIGDDRVDYVEASICPDTVRARVWWTP